MKKNFWIGVIVGVIVFVGIAATGFGIGLYRYNWESPVVHAIVNVLPYPALKVNRYTYSYGDYLDDLEGLNFFLNQNSEIVGDLDEMQMSVLQSAFDALILEVLAGRYEIKITDEDYDKAFASFLGSDEPTEEDIEEFDTWLKDNYNWDLDTYKEKVIRLFVLSEKVGEKVISDLNNETNFVAKETMDEAYAELVAGADFSELAITYSEDATAAEGGDLGWFSPEMMVDEFSEKLVEMEVGAYTEVFPTRFGYHIVKLEDKRINEETGIEEYKASHIIRMGVSLDEIIEEEKTSANVDIYLNGIDLESLLY